ncbi:Acetoacetyl-CoA synthetase like protein [Argiope bruennichi]|uniref:Acetoacetyl-CoA synthetase like protein n=1 Tax=Argiope bruennichi TaxID=94029 RepID=A0A8T0EG01_ARGBR|nr:Acetoacetyl-CoA synthetase like protein [Argiope bruennichi]
MSNKKEAVFAYLATAAIGAVWCGCLPLLGPKATLSRFEQLQVFQVYRKVVYCPTKLKRKANISEIPNCVLISEFLQQARKELRNDPKDIEFEQLPFDHPLCISFTSGTTGAPKGLVHSAGGSSDVSSGPLTNSPFIIKATVSSSDNLPVISATNSVSHGSSKIQPSVMLASTTNNNSGVGTCFNDKVCFEKSHDRISNTSNTQLDVTSSVQSCQKESDVSCIITSYYSIKSSSDPVTNSTAEKSDAIRSQPSISIPINQPGSLQYMWEPISKKRYVVKASIPFTPK